MARFAGKTAVVLGCSASGGSGWAIAEALAGAGMKVTVAARSEAPLRVLAGKIGGHAVVCNAADPAQIQALAETAVRAHGRIDVAVNAAGRPGPGRIADTTAAAIQKSLDVNYIANVHFIREMAERMNDGGSIVLMSSMAALRPGGDYFPYACARAASDCLVRYAAMEFAPRGIRVNSVHPGPIRSDMARDMLAVPGVEETFTREIPLGRVGEPADYADVVLWLAGPAFVTGLDIPVCGGQQLTRMPRPEEFLGDAAP
jgi:NAD(P)-dependent dehydrogenase (short-subunit alcohol dehydrogenase family)